MLGNINYPVKVILAIELKNGNRFRFSATLPETEKQMIERLYRLSTEASQAVDGRQLSLQTNLKTTRITTVGGKIIETKDGVNWEEVHGVPSPMRSSPPIKKSMADCGVYGFHCGTDKCPYPLYECIDRERGKKAMADSTLAREQAKGQIERRKRGRPRKTESSNNGAKDHERLAKEAARIRAEESKQIENCEGFPDKCAYASCPRAEIDCYRRLAGRKQAEKKRTADIVAKSPKHSGELCKAKVAECEFFCTSTNCVHYKKPLIYWSICKGERFPDGCVLCTEKTCALREPPFRRLCTIETAACESCDNPYCLYANLGPKVQSGATSETVEVEKVFGDCDKGVSLSCLEDCQDSGCKFYRGTPMCKKGFPDKCATTCRETRCIFYRWFTVSV
jgi:hypothetical protein